MHIRTVRKIFVLAILSLYALSAVFSQEMSEKKEIAVFNLSYYDFSIPNGALGAIDEQIRSVFINLGRFEVIGMTYRLGQDDVNEFIRKIQEYKELNTEKPEEVLLGREAFTEADFNRLMGSFIVVVPSVSYFQQETNDDGDISTDLETSFTFVNVEELTAFGQFFVSTSGLDQSSEGSIQDAVYGIPGMLEFEIRKMPEFQLKTGITYVEGRKIELEFGKNMGVQLGDEYSIVTSGKTASGRTAVNETGLMVINEVQEDFSYATLLYSDEPPVIGDQLQEVPRFGVEITPYAHGLLADGGDSLVGAVGLRGVVSRGFYNLRPLIAAEVPFKKDWLKRSGNTKVDLLPFTVSAGAELRNIYLGRLQVTPTASVGAGMVAPTDKEGIEQDIPDIEYLSHLGGTGQLTISYLMNKNLKVFAEAGFSYWWGVAKGTLGSDTSWGIAYYDSYGGPFLGAGIVWKY